MQTREITQGTYMTLLQNADRNSRELLLWQDLAQTVLGENNVRARTRKKFYEDQTEVSVPGIENLLYDQSFQDFSPQVVLFSADEGHTNAIGGSLFYEWSFNYTPSGDRGKPKEVKLKFAYLEALFVAQNYQKRGFGKRFFEAFSEHHEDTGCTILVPIEFHEDPDHAYGLGEFFKQVDVWPTNVQMIRPSLREPGTAVRKTLATKSVSGPNGCVILSPLALHRAMRDIYSRIYGVDITRQPYKDNLKTIADAESIRIFN